MAARNPLTNYTRGRSREYETMRRLRDDGWVCSRSAMSHGPVDVFAAKDGIVRLIQVKSGSSRMKKGEVEILKSWGDAFGGIAEVWYYRKRGRLQRHVVRDQKVAGVELPITSSARPVLP
jgi:Holliday junction resolvase